jgi:hypothetical protein
MATISDKPETWIEMVHNKHDEYYYRYIYDAYLTALYANGSETAYKIVKEEGKYHLIYVLDKTIELSFNKEEELKEFAEYLKSTFCGDHTIDMNQWFEKAHERFLYDRNNWEKGDS